ncbi:MAG: hypothetical protein HKN21_07740 [Candidatus Eisenbacteria bacterium]|uniref:Damage-inducible protein DinB n=1 Tax=Eiseniibacteriota bacterium TaxID=2212470 RepID=A0A7Y2H2E0_UNCEI|nr:hypothetical protein [Candidatus Eisenbacteria bacterium]
MNSLDLIKQMVLVDVWANDRVLKVMEDASGKEPDVARGLLGHIFAAQQIWLSRLQGDGRTEFEVFPKRNLVQLRLEANNMQGLLGAFVQGLSSSDLELEVTYSTIAGVDHSSTMGQMLTHLFSHGAYHRGQINQQLRETGIEPPAVDTIVYHREQAKA